MDTLRKVLKYNGYKVKHVMNITDVGHLVSDADEGEDKMAKTARIENRSVYEIAKEYTDAFMKDIKALNIDTPEHIAKATEHIREMEIYVNDIVKMGMHMKHQRVFTLILLSFQIMEKCYQIVTLMI